MRSHCRHVRRRGFYRRAETIEQTDEQKYTKNNHQGFLGEVLHGGFSLSSKIFEIFLTILFAVRFAGN